MRNGRKFSVIRKLVIASCLHPANFLRCLSMFTSITNDGMEKVIPKKLKGPEISIQARIIGVADAYDAMTCDRTYRKGLSRTEAICELKKNAGTQFDPEVTRIFIEKVLDRSVLNDC